jgi:hypothetical protein
MTNFEELRNNILKESKEDREPASPDEASMALKQSEFIEYVGREIGEHIKMGKEFPEWMQNKLSALHQKAKDMHSTLGAHGGEDDGDMYESVKDISEAETKFATGDKKKPLETDKTALAPDRSAAKKPIKYTKPDGSIGIKMVPVDRDIIKKINILNKVSDISSSYEYEDGEYINEKLSVKDGVGAWISDFKNSDAPQFKNKSDKERRDMALAAYLAAKKESETRKKKI